MSIDSRRIALDLRTIHLAVSLVRSLVPLIVASSCPEPRYVIIYRPADDGVEILHVRHGSQDLVRLFSVGQ